MNVTPHRSFSGQIILSIENICSNDFIPVCAKNICHVSLTARRLPNLCTVFGEPQEINQRLRDRRGRRIEVRL